MGETLFVIGVGCGGRITFFGLLQAAVFFRLIDVLLLVGHGFHHNQKEHSPSNQIICCTQGLVTVSPCFQNGQGEQQDQRILIQTDEEQIEHHPSEAGLEGWGLSEYAPAIIFLAAPEFPAVAAAAGKVVCQSHTPKRNQDGHDVGSGFKSRRGGEMPTIVYGDETP